MANRSRLLLSGLVLIFWLLLLLFPWHEVVSSEMDLSAILQGPSWQHPFGTDNVGRDLLTNFSKALLETVLPMWLTVITASLTGYLSGLVAICLEAKSFWLRLLRITAQILGVSFLSVPLGIFVFLLALMLERAGLAAILIAMTIFAFFRSMLLVFELYTTDRNLGYWQAHFALGGQLKSRLFHYGVAKSWRSQLISNVAFSLSMAISIEAALSYLGFGVQPPKLSFGNILSAHYNQFLHGHFSILFVTLAVMGLCYLVPVAIKSLASEWLADPRR